MIFMKQRHNIKILSLLLIFSMIGTSLPPVYAAPSTSKLENEVSGLENELSGLKADLKTLTNEISSIANQIAELNEEIQKTQSELATAKGNEEMQYAAMKTRIKYMYENGNKNILEMFLSSDCMADFLKRQEYYFTITEYDRAALQRLIDTKEEIAAKEEELAENQKELLVLQEELNSKEETLKNQISDTSSELEEANAALEKAREEAKKAQEKLEQEVKPVAPPQKEPEKAPEKEPEKIPEKEPEKTPEKEPEKIPEKEPEKTPEKPTTPTSASELELFAALIECEAGTRDYQGMLAVGSVVVNRMNHPRYPNTIRGVIYQAGQFTPVSSGKVDRVLARGINNSCLQAAKDALAGKNNIGNCLSFRSASTGHVGIIIGGNVFF